MGVAPGVFARLESTAQNGMDTDGIKIIRRDDASCRDLGAVADAEGRAHDFGHDEGVNQSAVPLQIEEIRPGSKGRARFAARRPSEGQQLLLVGYCRVWAEQDPFDPTEDSGIGTDA